MSPSLIASSMSWVTITIVLPRSFCRRRNSRCSPSRTIGSTALNGSSINMIRGSGAGAGATPTPPFVPPGKLGRVTPGELGRQPDPLQQFQCGRAAFPAGAAEQHRHGGHVVEHGAVREQPGVLDDVA